MADKITYEIHGGKELSDRLEELSDKAGGWSRASLAFAGKKGPLERARENAPYATGRLRESLIMKSYQRKRKGEAVVIIGPRAGMGRSHIGYFFEIGFYPGGGTTLVDSHLGWLSKAVEPDRNIKDFKDSLWRKITRHTRKMERAKGRGR